MNDEKEVRKALLEIERKHYDFFKENQKSIVDYIYIHWSDPVYLSIKDIRISAEVCLDLIEIFEIV